MAVAINGEMDFSSKMQSLDDEYFSALAKLSENYSEEDNFTLIDLIEKFKVSMNYLRINDHTKFWTIFQTIIVKEIIFREKVILIGSDADENMKYSDQEKKSIIWKFGVYNNFRLVLLQELSNVLTDLYEKAKIFLNVNSSVTKKIVHQADNVSNYYITQFKSLKQTDTIEEDNFINSCITIVENSIQIGKESLKI